MSVSRRKPAIVVPHSHASVICYYGLGISIKYKNRNCNKLQIFFITWSYKFAEDKPWWKELIHNIQNLLAWTAYSVVLRDPKIFLSHEREIETLILQV